MYEVRGNIAIILLDHPPVNSLNHALREKISKSIEAANADINIAAIVLTGANQYFSAGADIKEFGTEAQFAQPMLRDLVQQIETSSKPIVAAINGIALGGGLELALACHARVAEAASKVGFPEIKLGLIPGAGGTQRLPRLIGMVSAYHMIKTGEPVLASSLSSSGLFDLVVPDAALEHAYELASQSDIKIKSKSTIENPPIPHLQEGLAFLDQQRQHFSVREQRQPAYQALIEALHASQFPIEVGQQRERELFLSLLTSQPAQALRYLYRAERDAVQTAASFDGATKPINTVAVIGTGTMGRGIAISFLSAGFNVILLDQNNEVVQTAQQFIENYYAERLEKNKINAESVKAIREHLETTSDWKTLGQADLIIEAVSEELTIKQQVFSKAQQFASAETLFATNTSYLDIEEIAQCTDRSAKVLGLHFFNPAQVMRVVEVVRTARTDTNVIALGMQVVKRLKKLPISCRNSFGFIGNRIYNAYRKECELMLEDGALPEQIDQAMEAFGFAMGPFAVADLSGLDIAWRMRQANAAKRDPRMRYVNILDKLCEQGRFGRKSGAGYYSYLQGKKSATTDQFVRDLIEQAAVARNITRQEIPQKIIQQRALIAMVNEAACLVKEQVTERVGDIDLMLTEGYGFPRWEGGPVFWAQQQQKEFLLEQQALLAERVGFGFIAGDLNLLFDMHVRG